MTDVADSGGEAAEAPPFPMPRTCPFDVPEGYAGLRDTPGLPSVPLPTGKRGWLVSRYDDARQVLLDPGVSSDRTRQDHPVAPIPKEMLKEFNQSLAGMDPPEHTVQRRMANQTFTVKRMQELRPHIQQLVDQHIDAMLAGPRPVDLMQALAKPVPSLMICELIGVPEQDLSTVEEITRGTLARNPEDRPPAFLRLNAYLDELVRAKHEEPGDDLLGRLVVSNRERAEADQLDLDDMVAMARLLLQAGHETTTNLIGLGTVALLEHPDQLAELKADPSLTPNAVEELLRYLNITDVMLSRAAIADVKVGDTVIPDGDGIFVLTGASNRDERVFDNPDTFDIHRGARNHLAFGYGTHQCLGQNLARMALDIVFRTLFARIPDLRLAVGVDELPLKDVQPYGFHEIPVTW
ncbi:cytochrome P450 [Amycolatopsis aidingensis]|uniref:cytochrome P450 n=1 Tax=Amycolatopsis aidingensis TaxID=2842453 RepID=UPI001C0CD899|nr:cytochrome P450 [Amycolatopsis aidingensis]